RALSDLAQPGDAYLPRRRRLWRMGRLGPREDALAVRWRASRRGAANGSARGRAAARRLAATLRFVGERSAAPDHAIDGTDGVRLGHLPDQHGGLSFHRAFPE